MRTGVTIVAVVVILVAQMRVQSPTLPPEVTKIERYLGTWTYDGEDKTPVTGGRVTCTSTRRRISGGFFVESHRECKTPRGDVTQVEVFGYDFQNRVYMYWGFNSSVVSTYTAPSMDGDRVVWSGIGLSSGNRCTEVFASGSTSSSDMCETTRDEGKTWIIRAEGKSTKTLSNAP